MIQSISTAERVRRERTSKLVTWLHQLYGFEPARCPALAVIAQFLGVRSESTAREVLRRAEIVGAIRLAKGPNSQLVQVLPGWHDQPVPAMPLRMAAPKPRKVAVQRAATAAAPKPGKDAVPRQQKANPPPPPAPASPQPEGAAGSSGTPEAGEGRSRTPPQASPGGFGAWLKTAAPGERFVYFRGHLAEARGVPPHRRQPEIARALQDAVEASGAAASGLVLLCTRREGETTEYLAIRRQLGP